MRLLLILLSVSLAAHAATYYVSGADGNDSNCTGLATTPYVSGVAQPCPWKTINGKVNGFNLQPDDLVLFKGGESFPGELKPGGTSGGTLGHTIIFGAYNLFAGVPILGGGIAFDPNNRGYFTLQNLRLQGPVTSGHDGDVFLYFQNVIFENTGTYGFYSSVANTVVQFDHCVFARLSRFSIKTTGATTVTVRNSMFLPNISNSEEGPFGIGTGGTADVDYSLIQTAFTVSLTNVTDGGHNLYYVDPKITAWPPSPKVVPRFVITIDDTANIGSFASLVSAALDPHGVKATLFANWASSQGQGSMDAGSQAAALRLFNAGHEIANHTLHHEDMTATQAFDVSSTNAAPTVTIDAAGHTITLSTSTPGNTVALDWSASKTIADLSTAVAGKGWTITRSVQNGKTRQSTLLLDELADSFGAQSVPYTALLDISAPSYKFFAHEINDNQDNLQWLTGTRPTTMAYPYGFNSAGLIAWLKANTATHGLVTARIVGGTDTGLASVPKWQFIQRPYMWTTSDTEETVRQWARRFYFYSISDPAYFLFYDHATTSNYWTRYRWFVDELVNLGAQFMTYGQLAAEIAADHSDDTTNWTKTYAVTGADYRLLPDSPAIGAGTTGAATDILGNPYLTNDIGAYACRLPGQRPYRSPGREGLTQTRCIQRSR